MALLCGLSIISSRVLIDTVRLQSDNYSLKSPYEFEQLIAPFMEVKHIRGTLLSDMYVLMQQVEMILVITFTSLMIDTVLVDFLENKVPLKPESKFYYLFGLLPIVDANQHTVAGTEIIKISFGFIITCALTFITFWTTSVTTNWGEKFVTKVLPVLRLLCFGLLLTSMVFIANPAK